MIHRSTNLDTALAACLEEALRALTACAGAIRLNPTPGAPPRTVQKGLGKHVIAALEDLPPDLSWLQEFPPDRTLTMDDLAACSQLPVVDALHREGLDFCALRPLRSGKLMLGVLALADRKLHRTSPVQAAFIATLADLIAAAIANARLHEQTEKLSEDLVALHEINKIISQSLDLDDIIRRIVIEGRRLVKTQQCHLFLLDDKQQKLIGSASTQEKGLKIRDVEISLKEESVAVRALFQERVIAVEDMRRLAHSDLGVTEAMRWRAAVFVPLITKEQAIGLLVCSDDSADRSFTQEEISRAETLAQQAAIALENARLFMVVSRSRKEWETTFDAMQDCVSVHDTTGKIIKANAALARRLKTTPPQMIGKNCSEIYSTEQLNFSSCRHMNSSESKNLMVEELDLPALCGTFQISVSPWYDKNNRLAGSIHVAKDISNEKLLRQQLIQSEKLSAIGELISGVAHELNNPLTGVMGYSQILQMRKDLDERARENLLKINSLALRCQKIVQNLLGFARKQKPERTFANVNDMLERTIELRNYELSVNNIEIVRDLDRSLPRTIADAHQLQQVFLNVITNAEYAMLQAHGRGRLCIRSHTDLKRDRIIVEIIDDGPGIPEAHLPKIFDPFFTTKDVGKGTGLGLSLSYGIIKEHGGDIYARSQPGEGATFIIEIPIITKHTDEPIAFPQLTPQTPPFETLVRNKRVLIVDDEKYILDFLVEIFRAFPIRVDTAADGRVAMDKLLKNDYDLVITDFRMPQMSGRDLYHWIREARPQLAKRIIFVTGDTVSAETQSFFEATCSRYLAKPFKIEDVKEAIQQTLEDSAR